MNFLSVIISTVEDITGIKEEEIKSKSRHAEKMQAKKLLVIIAQEYGISNDAIARLLNVTSAGVRGLAAAAKGKDNGKIFAINYTKIKKKLESNHDSNTAQKN